MQDLNLHDYIYAQRTVAQSILCSSPTGLGRATWPRAVSHCPATIPSEVLAVDLASVSTEPGFSFGRCCLLEI